MGMASVRGLAAHQDLFQLFKTDPLGALAQLEQRMGEKFPRLNRGDITFMQSLTSVHQAYCGKSNYAR
jgi:hypothetical protein